MLYCLIVSVQTKPKDLFLAKVNDVFATFGEVVKRLIGNSETRINRLNDLLANKYKGFYCRSVLIDK